MRGAALRYSGGFVPDTNQIVAKGTGCWACTPKLVSALFCALPAAFIIEKAGGASSTGDGRSVLDHRVFTPSEKLQLALGSANDVKLFDASLFPPRTQIGARNRSLRVGQFAVGCRRGLQRSLRWVQDAQHYKERDEQYCPGEEDDVSPFNVLMYLTHVKRGKGPVSFNQIARG